LVAVVCVIVLLPAALAAGDEVLYCPYVHVYIHRPVDPDAEAVVEHIETSLQVGLTVADPASEDTLDGVRLGMKCLEAMTASEGGETPEVPFAHELGREVFPNPVSQSKGEAGFNPFEFMKWALKIDESVTIDSMRMFRMEGVLVCWSQLSRVQDDEKLKIFLFFDKEDGQRRLNTFYMNSNALTVAAGAFWKRWEYPPRPCDGIAQPERQHVIRLGLDGKTVPEDPVYLAFDGAKPGEQPDRYGAVFDFYAGLWSELQALPADLEEADPRWQAYQARFDNSWREENSSHLSGSGGVEAVCRERKYIGMDQPPAFLIDADPLYLFVTPKWELAVDDTQECLVIVQKQGDSYQVIDEWSSGLSNLTALFQREDFRSQFRSILEAVPTK
jgi:hypothetical protein